MPISATKNPINRLVSRTGAADFRVPELPKLAEQMSRGYGPGHAAFDAAVEQWRRDVERTVGEKFGDQSTYVQQQLANVQAQLTALSSQVASASSLSLTEIQSQLAELAAVVAGLTHVTIPAPIITILPATALTIAAAEDVLAFQVMTVEGWVADSGNASRDFGRVAGISLADTPMGFNAAVVESGMVSNAGWTWVSGDVLFLNGVGALSTTAPTSGFVQVIGVARDDQNVLVDLEAPIVL